MVNINDVTRRRATRAADPSHRAEIDEAWDDDIDSRLEEILTGKVELVDGEETRRMIRADLAAHRRA